MYFYLCPAQDKQIDYPLHPKTPSVIHILIPIPKPHRPSPPPHPLFLPSLLILIRQLLCRPPNPAISIKLLPNHTLLIERSSNLLRRATDRSIRCSIASAPFPTQHRAPYLFKGRREEWMLDVPLNMEPMAPFLSNTLVPVPCVFSPRPGWLGGWWLVCGGEWEREGGGE